MSKTASTKRAIRKEWEEKNVQVLNESLKELKEIWGEKKFEKKIRKAARLLAPGKKQILNDATEAPQTESEV